MRALVIYESYFGNTRAVALAIGEGLRAGFDVDVVEVGVAPASVDGYDFLVVGGPTHAWSMSRENTRKDARQQAQHLGVTPVSNGVGIRDWLKSLPPTSKKLPAATFDTCAHTRWFPVGSAAKAAAQALTHMGFRVVLEPRQFTVSDTQGPLEAGQLESARAYGIDLAELVANRPSLNP